MQAFEMILDRAGRMLTDWLSLKNIGQALDEMDPQVVWTGIDEGSSVRGKETLRELFCRADHLVSPRLVSDLSLEIRAQDKQLCVVEGSCNLRPVGEGERDLCRITLVYAAKEEERARLISGHLSVPIFPSGSRRRPTEMVRWTEYQRLSRALREKSAQLELFTRSTLGGLMGLRLDGRYTYFYVNEKLCAMLGYTHREYMEMSGGCAVGAVYPPDRAKALETVNSSLAVGDTYEVEYRIRNKAGDLVWVLDSGRRIVDADGEQIIYSVVSDISRIKEAAEQLRIERERYAVVAELVGETSFEYDMESDTLLEFRPSKGKEETGRIEYTGMNSVEGLQRVGIHPDECEQVLQKFRTDAVDAMPGKLTVVEFRRRQPDGSYAWRRVLMRYLSGGSGEPAKVVGTVIDISSERMLLQEVHTDSLTGAYNRSYIKYEIERYLKKKTGDVFAGCLMLDIDRFKQLNDSCGHLCGDMVLTDLVKMMKRLYRATDLVARIGGDEFMVFMKDVYSIGIVEEKAGRLLEMARRYAAEAEISFDVTLSIGITTTCQGAASFEELYRQADIALYAAKAAGRDCYRTYSPEMRYPTEMETV